MNEKEIKIKIAEILKEKDHDLIKFIHGDTINQIYQLMQECNQSEVTVNGEKQSIYVRRANLERENLELKCKIDELMEHTLEWEKAEADGGGWMPVLKLGPIKIRCMARGLRELSIDDIDIIKIEAEKIFHELATGEPMTFTEKTEGGIKCTLNPKYKPLRNICEIPHANSFVRDIKL